MLGTPRRPHVEFDHLSIVSEESQRSPNDDGRLQPPNLDAKSKIPESPLGDLQSVMPPLKHFENIQYESVGPGNVGKKNYLNKFSFKTKRCRSYHHHHSK